MFFIHPPAQVEKQKLFLCSWDELDMGGSWDVENLPLMISHYSSENLPLMISHYSSAISL